MQDMINYPQAYLGVSLHKVAGSGHYSKYRVGCIDVDKTGSLPFDTWRVRLFLLHIE